MTLELTKPDLYYQYHEIIDDCYNNISMIINKFDGLLPDQYTYYAMHSQLNAEISTTPIPDFMKNKFYCFVIDVVELLKAGT